MIHVRFGEDSYFLWTMRSTEKGLPLTLPATFTLALLQFSLTISEPVKLLDFAVCTDTHAC